MRRKLAYRASVCALLSAMTIGQTANTYAAVSVMATQGNWKFENQEWKYYDSAGNLSTGWVYTNTGWYYLHPESGKMLTGWQVIDGKKYYLNTAQDGIEGSMYTGWKQDENGNWFFMSVDENGSPAGALTGWNWIDGHCYYFGSGDGAEQGVMYAGRRTPDGYLTDAQGRWVEEDGSVHYEENKGISGYSDNSGVSGPGAFSGAAAGTVDGVSGSTAGGSSTTVSSGSSGGSSGGGSSSGGSSSSTGSSSISGSVDGVSGSTSTTGNAGSTNSGSTGSGSTGNAGNTGSTSGGIVDGVTGSTPGSSNGNAGNSGNTGNTNNSGTGSIGGETNSGQSTFMDVQKTRLVDIGWAQYAVITFRYGTIDNYKIEVDGTDITAACTKVDDAGTVVKWEVTSWNPGELTAIRKTDGREHTATLSSGSSSGEIQVRTGESAPAYILTNGPIDSFDFYLENYDKDGNVRTKPAYTTFSINGSRAENTAAVPFGYYVSDSLIDESGNGEITVKLALATEEHVKWFEGLSRIKALDTNNDILNSNVAFTSSIVEDEFGRNGIIRILLPQTNFYARGRYQLNLASSNGSETKNVPVHLVDNRQFVMKLNTLNPNPKTGECFAFDISGPNGETFGTEILPPIYRVDLTMPSGNTVTLEKLNDWYEIGPMLHICGTNNDEEVITGESGVYTVTVYADGYLPMTKKVEIAGDSLGMTAERYLEDDIDGISSASLSGGSGSVDSDSDSTSSINAFLLFDHDLLANALLLDEIGSVNEDADAVLTRWYDQEPVSVMGKDAEVLFDYTDYLNTVKDAKLELGKYLSFAEYAQLGQGVTQNRPSQVKRVLEDGLLGASFRFSDAVGKAAPALLGTCGKLGRDLVLTCEEDEAYISMITSMSLDGKELIDGTYLKHYERAEDGSSLTIYAESKGTAGGGLQLTAGSHILHIVAEGYENVDVTLQVEKDLEQFELSLMENPEAQEDDLYAYYVGQDVYVNAADEDQNELRGDFMKNLTGITLKRPDGTSRTVTSDLEGQIGGDENYVKDEYSFTLLKGLFKEAGEYVVTASADGYAAKILEFTVLEADRIPAEPGEELALPEMESAEYVKSFFDGNYYRIAFGGLSDEEMDAYLKDAEKTVSVNGEEYKNVSFFWNSTKSYKIVSEYGVSKYMDLTEDVFEEGENTITIEADGYGPLELTLEILEDGTVAELPEDEELPGTGQLPGEEELPDEEIPGEEEIPGDGEIEEDGLLDTPEVENVKYDTSDFFTKKYVISFTGLSSDEIKEYLSSEEKSVTVNGNEYSDAGYSLWGRDLSYMVRSEYGEAKYLELTTDGFKTGENTIVIEVEGYRTIEIAFEISANGQVVSGSLFVVTDLLDEEDAEEAVSSAAEEDAEVSGESEIASKDDESMESEEKNENSEEVSDEEDKSADLTGEDNADESEDNASDDNGNGDAAEDEIEDSEDVFDEESGKDESESDESADNGSDDYTKEDSEKEDSEKEDSDGENSDNDESGDASDNDNAPDDADKDSGEESEITE